MSIQTSAGAKISASVALPATFDAAGYAALTYTEIGSVESIGAFGREYALVEFNPLGERGTKKFKGSFNEGQLALTLALDNTNAGQDLLRANVNADGALSFKVALKDGTVYYFIALVMNNPIEIGSVDQITMTNVNLEITTGTGGVGVVIVEPMV